MNAHTAKPRRVPFLGFDLVAESTDTFLRQLLDHARARQRLLVGYLNAAQVNLAYQDEDFCRRLAALDAVYADGMAIVWASRRFGEGVPERINAGDFTRDLMAGLASRGLKLALVGGRPGEESRAQSEAAQAARRFTRWAPELRIVYTHHGYFSEAEAETVHADLEAADPDLVLLGMGAPRQERWAQQWGHRGNPRVWWCVGALFEYYSGTRLRAPAWVRRAGLEWLVRLLLEPRRLWRRYLLGNPSFVYRVLRRQAPPGLRSGPPAS